MTPASELERLLGLHLKALPCLTICYPCNHPTLAQHHVNIGYLFSMHKPDELLHAVEHYEQATAMFTACLGGDHPKTTTVRNKLKELKGETPENVVFRSY